MSGLCRDLILQIMNFLPEEDIYSSAFKKYLPDHINQRTSLSPIHNTSDLLLARRYPKASYSLSIYAADLYSELEPDEYPKVLKLTTSIYIPPFFRNLQSLNVSHSFLSVLLRLPPELTNLKDLDCSQTLIRDLPVSYVNLIRLDVSHSRVEQIPEQYTLLEILNVRLTRVADLSPVFTRLVDLDCANTEVIEIPDTYKKLRKLDCRMTRVSSIPDTLTNLDWLDCSNSRVDYVSEKIRRLPMKYFKEKALYQLNYYLPIT